MNLHHFSSQRIFLRRCEEMDADLLYALENDPQIDRTNTLVEPLALFEARQITSARESELLSNGFLLLVACLRQSEMQGENIPIGIAQLYDFNFFHRRSAVGIVLKGEYQHRGYGEKVLHMLINYAFKALSLHQVYAEIYPTNIAAKTCFSKVGFQKVATLPQWYKMDDGYQDLEIHTITKKIFYNEH